MQNLTICLCLDLALSHQTVFFLLFMAEYAECNETSQKILIKEIKLMI